MTTPLPTGETPAQPNTSVPASVTPPTSTQVPAEPPVEEWDKERAAATIKAQREQEKIYKAQLKELETLKADAKAKADAELSEIDRLRKQSAEQEAANKKLVTDILRRDVIAETGLPSVFADRLKGETKEAMLADAQEILKVLPQTPQTQKQAPHLNNAASPNNAQIPETEAQKRERLFGKQTNVFDMNAIREGGGGVVWTQPPEK